MIGSSLVGRIRSILYVYLTIKLKSDQRKSVPPSDQRSVAHNSPGTNPGTPQHRPGLFDCQMYLCLLTYSGHRRESDF